MVFEVLIFSAPFILMQVAVTEQKCYILQVTAMVLGGQVKFQKMFQKHQVFQIVVLNQIIGSVSFVTQILLQYSLKFALQIIETMQKLDTMRHEIQLLMLFVMVSKVMIGMEKLLITILSQNPHLNLHQKMIYIIVLVLTHMATNDAMK